MPKIIDEPPVAALNKILSKLKIVPKFELISSEVHRGTSRFIMRVTSPITPGGQPFVAEGCYGMSKKEAKHNAALTFMQAFLNYGSDIRYTKAKTDSKYTDDAGRDICSQGLAMLKIICSKKNLRRPEIRDAGAEELSSELIFTSECIVSDLRIKGRGKSAVEARLHAVSRMIQILMETVPIHEILGCPQLTSEMLSFPIKSNGSEETSPNNNHEGLLQNGSSGKRKMDESSVEKPREMHRAHRRPETAKTLLELIEARKKDVKIEQSKDNSESNVNLTQFVENSKKKKLANESSSTSLNNNSDSIENGVVNPVSDYIRNNFTRLRAVSEIDRALKDLEKQLYYKILNALVYSHLAHHQTVAIFSHNYQVLINENTPPQVFEGNTECTDQSIKVACLTKLLLNLKEHINNNVIIKQEQ